MENFVDQTISKAEKHKYEVVTNLGVDDIRNAFDFRSKISSKKRFSVVFEKKANFWRIFECKKALLLAYLEVLLSQL